jgi:hypothetical protein
MGTRSPDLSAETPQSIAQAVTDIAELYAAHDGDGGMDADPLALAMTRVVMGQWPGVDRAVLDWLLDAPSPQKLGVAAQILWHLWSTAVPHPPIRPDLVRSLIEIGRNLHLSVYELAPFRAVLSLAARQVDDPEVMALIEAARAGP